MKNLFLCFIAFLLVVACSYNAKDIADGNSDNDSIAQSKTQAVVCSFIEIPDTTLVGTWISVSGSDSIVVTLERDGSANSLGTQKPYTEWKQVMANVIVLTRSGLYGGTVIDAAFIDVISRPMTLVTRGSNPLYLIHQ